MKLTSFFLLAASLQVSARVHSQTVSYSASEVPLEEVFPVIKAQTGYVVFCNANTLQGIKPVSISAKNLQLEDFLKELLKGLPLEYTIKKKTIIISPAMLNNSDPNLGPPRDTTLNFVTVTGKVTNQKGEPLAGASVMVKGSRKGTITGADGTFTLKGVGPGIVLIVSYAGFTQKEMRVEKSTDLSFMLTPSTSPLDEAKVIAYGTTTDRFNTGDVTTVKAEDIEKQPVNNPLLALEGRVPGLFIQQTTGLAGGGISVQIRGQNSIANGGDPFYVIDGVPYSSQLLPNYGSILGSSVVGGAYGNPLSFVNPSDIESISVLKDADATAIYGSRAANGAILITTKKGRAGQTRVDINLQSGWGEVTRKLHLFNTPEYLEMRHEAILNDGLTTQPSDYDINGLWDTTRYTDWQKALIGNNAQYTNLTASTSGGNTNTQYLISGTYHRESTVFPGEFSDEKGSLHFNLNSIATNQRFRVQLNGSYLFDLNRLPQADLTNVALQLAPDAPKIYNSDGTINWAPSGSGSSSWLNPLALDYNTYENKSGNLIGNAILSYQIIPGLDLKSSFGYNNLQTNEFVGFPLISQAPESRATGARSAQYTNNNINSWIIEPMITYVKAIGNGKLDALGGGTINQVNSNGYQFGAYGFNSDQVLRDIQASSGLSSQSATSTVYKYAALFGRVNYRWRDEYIADLTFRRDGSSRFGPANEYHDFAAAGISWIFSQQQFFKDVFPAISLGKIKASYGTTGNDQIGDYQYLNLYSFTSAQVPYQGQVGLQPNGLTNPYLQWEETKKLQFSLDLGFFKDRILIGSNYYRNRSSNELLSYQLPIITGFTSVTKNFPATLQNSGWEFTLSTINVKTKNFDWSTHINLSIPETKLLAFPNLATSGYATQFKIGEPVTMIYVYQFKGVDPQTGLYQFSDGHGGLTPSPDTATNPTLTTRTKIINTVPRYYGGFENIIRYKGFELDFLFQFVKQLGQNYYFGNFIAGLFNGGRGNQPVYLLNRWQKVGDIASHQKFTTGYSYYQQWSDASFNSDASYTDASYIRLKNLSFSWQMPMAWRSKAHIKDLHLFVQGQNLLTFTHYQGLDPETRSSTTLPPLRVLTVGTRITL